MNAPARIPAAPLRDALQRPLRDLRISLTDRCNFRCPYCMPRAVFGRGHRFLPQAQLLHFEEIERLVRRLAPMGVRKLRLTGGEPLLRHDVETLISRLVSIPGIEDLSLTSNGVLLDRARAEALAAAGLKRITLSLDALDDALFRRMSDADYGVERVLAAVGHAQAAGLAPVKINAVIQRGVNEDQILPLAAHFRGSGCILRFIEYMDVGSSNGWTPDQVVTADSIIARLQARWPLTALPPAAPGETARRWRYRDGQGEIGVIASVTQAFCGSCQRARLSADGQLFTCLFASHGHDLRALLRSGISDERLDARLREIWTRRADRYSEARQEAPLRAMPKVEMSYIGG